MKTTVTIGRVDGRDVVLRDPSHDTEGHIEYIRELTNSGGKIKSGKITKQVSEAVVVHSTKGTIKRRQF